MYVLISCLMIAPFAEEDTSTNSGTATGLIDSDQTRGHQQVCVFSHIKHSFTVVTFMHWIGLKMRESY